MFIAARSAIIQQPIYGRKKHFAPSERGFFGFAFGSINISPLRGEG
jgi:hypothetical protein